jgi:hypothetical protein
MPEMTHIPKRSELVAEVAELLVQVLEATANATFVGWTPGADAEQERRHERLVFLRRQLADLPDTAES